MPPAPQAAAPKGKPAPAMSSQQLQQALAAAEDDGDRRAALGLQAELAADEKEFDESAVVPPQDDVEAVEVDAAPEAAPDATAASSPAVGVTDHGRVVEVPAALAGVGAVGDAGDGEATEEAVLAVHLARLRDIDKHSLAVLERYLAPLHDAQLAEARQAVQAREAQLQQMRDRISMQVSAIVSDDEEQLFYNRDEAYRTYMHGAASAPAPAPYGPPSTDPRARLYVEPGHLTLYRVGFVAFVPLRPKRKTGPADAWRTAKLARANSGPVKPPQGDENVRDAVVSDNVPLPYAQRASLFRRKEELRAGEFLISSLLFVMYVLYFLPCLLFDCILVCLLTVHRRLEASPPSQATHREGGGGSCGRWCEGTDLSSNHYDVLFVCLFVWSDRCFILLYFTYDVS